MNFDWFHASQVEGSDNHVLFFECKRRHFSIKNTTATRPRHKHSTGNTVLPLGLAQPKEQPRLLQQLPRFYLLPFPKKKLGYLRTWTPHVQWTCCDLTQVFLQRDWGRSNTVNILRILKTHAHIRSSNFGSLSWSICGRVVPAFMLFWHELLCLLLRGVSEGSCLHHSFSK